MTHVREIAFIDASVSDPDTIIGGLRPEVEAITLVATRRAARQIAGALQEREPIYAVRVIAHGTSRRVTFAPGDRSLQRLGDRAEDVTAIGRALGDDGRLRLRNHCAGAGTAGPKFVMRLAHLAGAETAAAGRQ